MDMLGVSQGPVLKSILRPIVVYFYTLWLRWWIVLLLLMIFLFIYTTYKQDLLFLNDYWGGGGGGIRTAMFIYHKNPLNNSLKKQAMSGNKLWTATWNRRYDGTTRKFCPARTIPPIIDSMCAFNVQKSCDSPYY